MISISNSLNRQIVWTTTIVAFVSLSVMFFGFIIYGYIYQWLDPSEKMIEFAPSDFVVLGINVAIGQAVGAIVGWRLARRIVTPLVSLTDAVRSIAGGDFKGRTTELTMFGEVDQLIANFNEMAEKLEKAEQELTYSNSAIAHELRTPLTILRGRLQGLVDGVYQPTSDVFQGLIKQVDSLSRIVEDLRTLSLMNAGSMELHFSKFELAEEVAEIIETMKPALEAARVTSSTDLRPVSIRADRARIRQAVIAVIDNVGRYAPGSHLHVEISIWLDTVKLCISDNGPGIKPTDHNFAFERFWRADEARTRDKGGSGLGLSIVHAIAVAHGGKAKLGAGGGGTSIEIYLPLR